MAFTEETAWSYDRTRFNEDTLFKVRDSLISYGLSDSDVTDCITHMQNKGILFREVAPELEETESHGGGELR